ncbi:PREDICTED: uncharacterized protein LOC108756160 [Trachymyrmex septentrionalis]|uniref:uncharacterized protein LOC108756160 n=1 Tax=Trachymyrmex septentrionalis TaxID=34720 RepID=UPI00084F2985|nr:PREDICTED: uncharacterized protein LOC108756160 [Trachymyrmex septentrionalis]
MQNHGGEMQSAVKYYYNINKIFMSKLGTWPTQSIFEKTLLPAIFTIFVASIGFLELVKLSEVWKTNLIEDCESLFIFLLAVGAHVKFFFIIIQNKNVRFHEM